ncbi:MAG TPA: hypothetical protein VD794_09195 [Flavisolibacter sp.]|nr:hypothetical protein [Flavisolibacter sp.]
MIRLIKYHFNCFASLWKQISYLTANNQLQQLFSIPFDKIPDASFSTKVIKPETDLSWKVVHYKLLIFPELNLFDKINVYLISQSVKQIQFISIPITSSNFLYVKKVMNKLYCLLGPDAQGNKRSSAPELSTIEKGGWGESKWLVEHSNNLKLPLILEQRENYMVLTIFYPL